MNSKPHSAQWQRERDLITAHAGDDSLTVRDRIVLAMRYNLPALWPDSSYGPMAAGCPLTYDGCGLVIGLSGTRAQQIIREALRKLRKLEGEPS